MTYTWLPQVSGLALSVLLVANTASAQTAPPPRHDTKSPTGVSYRTLTFTYDEEDLSIGGEGREGIAFRRSYSSKPSSNPSYFLSAFGWTDNFSTSVSNEPVARPPFDDPWVPNEQPWYYHISIGAKTYSFVGGTTGGTYFNPSHVPWGPYQPISRNGTQLVYNGTNNSGYYTLTESDGTITNFAPHAFTRAMISNITYPDGTRLEYTYVMGNLESVFSNRGWAILFDAPTTACVVNIAQTYVSATSACPSGARSVTYGYTQGVYYTGANNLTSITKAGATANYDYTSFDHLGCLRDPGQTVCKISNTYGECWPVAGDPNYSDHIRHMVDPVVSQQTASGETYAYSPTTAHCRETTPDQPDMFPWSDNTVTMTVNGTQTTRVDVNTGGMPKSITDALGRRTGFLYESPTIYSWSGETVDISAVSEPEGGAVFYYRDDRGNVYQTIKTPKSGSGLSDITTTASFPPTCGNTKTCNKPASVTDANLNTTSYSYDGSHGGVLTETGPAVGGIQPVKRYAYAQHYAWLAASGGGYMQAASPVWLLSEERTCRASATIGNACAAGMSDEVVVSYQYEAGNASTPSNLLLKGKAVTADGQTLRTCYGYDSEGNRIWETAPRAGLATCA